MLPLGHLAFGYLCYVAVAFLRGRPLPARWALLAVAAGSQFPDVVDKPLAYYELLTYGRSFAHSAFTFAAVAGVVWWVAGRVAGRWPAASRRERVRAQAPLAFTVGYASHLVGDAAHALLAGRFFDARFLLWPVYALPEVAADEVAPWVRMWRIYQTMETHPQRWLLAAAVVVFVALRVKALVDARRARA